MCAERERERVEIFFIQKFFFEIIEISVSVIHIIPFFVFKKREIARIFEKNVKIAILG